MKYFVVTLCLILSACTTPYGPNGLTGGYQDKKIDDDSYIVSFYGNGHTREQQVWNYWIYRCAELTKQKGYSFFTLETSEQYAVLPPPPGYQHTLFQMLQNSEDEKVQHQVQYYYYTNITTYSSNAIVHMYKVPVAKDIDITQLLDAQYILDQLKPYVQSQAKATLPDRQSLLLRSSVEATIKAHQLTKDEAERIRSQVL